MELLGEDVETLKQEPGIDSGQPVEPDVEGAVAENEEEGIAEAVARWQRRKQERLQSDQQFSNLQDQGVERTQANEQNEKPTTSEDNTDVAQKYGFIVEGCEFERYGKKAHDTSKWDWRIGKQPDNDDEDGGGQKQNNRTSAEPRAKHNGKRRKEDDDDDDWRGDSEGEKELLSARKRPVARKKNVQTRKKRMVVSTSDAENEGKTKHSGVATTSTSTKKASKLQSRASEDEDDDLDGFLVDDDEEETEVAEEEDEWTDEDEEEVVEEDDEIEEDPGRPVDGDNRPLCKYGNNCFRKNKDHLAQFRH